MVSLNNRDFPSGLKYFDGSGEDYALDEEDGKCFQCGKDSTKSLVTIVITRKTPYDTITRELVCNQCNNNLPIPMTRRATKKESDLYLERWADGRFGKI